MTNHTPAPWTADGDLIRGADGTDILTMDPFGQQEEGVLWANMDLIAAAPAMLEALRYIVAWTPEGWNAEVARNKALAAIALAEGRDP